MTTFESVLKTISLQPIFDFELIGPHVAKLDLSRTNPRISELDPCQPESIQNFVDRELALTEAHYGIGGYDEDRVWYQRNPAFFQNGEPRTFHLGIDVWAPYGTPLCMPLAGTVHSFKDNAAAGDYGPTIIFKHSIEDFSFFVLYGHLSQESLKRSLAEGKKIAAGNEFATIGERPHNGDWPPHVHIQIILDIAEWKGDYPGVATKIDRVKMLANCPNPNLLLKSPLL